MWSGSLSQLRYWSGVVSGRRTARNTAHERYRRISQTLLSALLSRGVGFIVSFISVPLTVGYLGGERYGLWVSISTLLGWLSLADLGLANSLTNSLSNALAQDDKSLAQQYVATTFWLLVGVAAVVGTLFFAAWPWVNWRMLFNVQGPVAQHEIAPSMATAAMLVIVSLPLLVNAKVFYACQEGSLANYWGTAGNVASLVMIVLVVRLKLGLVWLVFGVSGTTLAASIISSLWLFGVHRPALRPSIHAVDRSKIKGLGKVSGQFFIVQIAVLLIFQSDNLIITHFLGAAQVTPYAVCFKLFSYATLLQALISPALWPAYTEAIVRQDVHWVRRTFWLTLSVNLSIAVAFAVPLTFFGRTLIGWWAGQTAVPTQTLLYWMAVWILISSAMNSVGCLLNGAGRIKGQSVYGTITAAVSITLGCLLVTRYGIVGVVAGMVVAFLLCNCLPASLEVAYFLRHLSKDIASSVLDKNYLPGSSL